MKIHGRSYRTIWPGSDGHSVEVIDQIQLPHRFATRRLETLEDAADAIRDAAANRAPERTHCGTKCHKVACMSRSYSETIFEIHTK